MCTKQTRAGKENHVKNPNTPDGQGAKMEIPEMVGLDGEIQCFLTEAVNYIQGDPDSHTLNSIDLSE